MKASFTAAMVAALVIFVAACGRAPDVVRSRESAKQYAMTGEVLRLEPKTNVAVVKHEEIRGWMEPMTMEFPVESSAAFSKLKPGMRIRATVFVRDLEYWIGDIVSQK